MASMLQTTAGRWLIGALAALALVALLAWARNDPGAGGRFPDPDDVHVVVVHDGPYAPQAGT